jgi:hypothetical protein
LLDDLGAAFERTLALADTAFLRLDAAPTGPKLELGRLPQLDELLLTGEDRRLAKGLRLPLRLLDDASRDLVR